MDRLLSSPHYGERWARPWLDLARYADTEGYEKDGPRTIWKYRDWVIDALGLIGSIAPLLGLLGTVLGMVGAFQSISKSASSNYEALASNISVALVTTLMGLILAIPAIALFTYFRNRIDAFASEAGIEIERLSLYLESANPSRPAAPAPRAAPAPARRPVPRPGGEKGVGAP